jgi:hypothetical protein
LRLLCRDRCPGYGISENYFPKSATVGRRADHTARADPARPLFCGQAKAPRARLQSFGAALSVAAPGTPPPCPPAGSRLHVVCCLRCAMFTRQVAPADLHGPAGKAPLQHICQPPPEPGRRLMPPPPGTAEHRTQSRVHRTPPRPDQWKERSRTCVGIGGAMADQCGGWATDRMAWWPTSERPNRTESDARTINRPVQILA